MPKVVLHFLRHSIKEKAPEKDDKDIKLSPEGRALAAEKFDDPMDMRYAHVVGSPRVRTHEIAVAAATGDSSLRPEDLGVGKVRVDETLDFKDEGGVYGEAFNKAYTDGRLLPFLLQESDVLARENGDTASSTYSRSAANIASIIHRNYEVASRGAAILEQSENPENTRNDFERVLATHGTIQECFLLKVVEKLKGVQERDILLSLIGDNGFDYVEGFDVTLSKDNGVETIRITYKKGDYTLDENVPIEIIEEIEGERQ